MDNEKRVFLSPKLPYGIRHMYKSLLVMPYFFLRGNGISIKLAQQNRWPIGLQYTLGQWPPRKSSDSEITPSFASSWATELEEHRLKEKREESKFRAHQLLASFTSTPISDMSKALDLRAFTRFEASD
jgi:hypothetical protein